jgi:hypothetical protein
LIADLFKTHPGRSVKNAHTILQNVHAVNVYLSLLITFCFNLKIGSNKREEKQNIGTNMETKVISLLNHAMVYLLKIQNKNTLLCFSVTGIFT